MSGNCISVCLLPIGLCLCRKEDKNIRFLMHVVILPHAEQNIELFNGKRAGEDIESGLWSMMFAQLLDCIVDVMHLQAVDIFLKHGINLQIQ